MIVTRRALDDLAEARDWYELQSAGLGKRFIAATNEAMALIEAKPLTYPVMIEPARRLNVRRFSFGVWYVAEG